MNVDEARVLARCWVAEEGRKIPGFVGAFFAWSTNFMDGNALMPSTSDVDVFILVDRDTRSLTKITYHGIIVEASIHPADRILRSVEALLGDFRYAAHLAMASVIH